jgi:hypothetical protein
MFDNVVEKSCSSAEWLDFDVDNITTSDYESLELRIKDSSGTWIPYDLLNPGILPITLNTPAFTSVNPLEYNVMATLASGITAFTTTPVITISDNDTPKGSICPIERCDADEDGFLGRNDIREILKARGQSADGPNDPRDADGNDEITAHDAKLCIKKMNF